MKKYLILLSLLVAFTSCSDDSDDDGNPIINTDGDDPSGDGGGGIMPIDDNDIEPLIMLGGTWQLTDVIIDEETTDATLMLVDQIFISLFEQECDLVTFDFMDSGTLFVTNSLGSLDVDVTFLVNMEVDCPTDFDTLPFTWNLVGDQLELMNDDGTQQIISIDGEVDTLIISGDGINSDIFIGNIELIDGFDLSVLEAAQAVFTRVE